MSHLYYSHHLFGTKQQRIIGPSHDEQYLGFGSAGRTVEMMVHDGSLGRLVVLCAARRIVHNSRLDGPRPGGTSDSFPAR
jgi:hypothetical protein